jgi:tetratricopeptide (TPR) repeat protein
MWPTVLLIGIVGATFSILLALFYLERRTAVMRLRYDPALTALRKLLTHNPRDADAHVKLSLMLARQRRFKEAIAALDSALEIAPDRADAHYHRALANLQMGKRDEAEKDLQWIRARTDNPYYKTATQQLIRRGV